MSEIRYDTKVDWMTQDAKTTKSVSGTFDKMQNFVNRFIKSFWTQRREAELRVAPNNLEKLDTFNQDDAMKDYFKHQYPNWYEDKEFIGDKMYNLLEIPTDVSLLIPSKIEVDNDVF